MFQYVMCLRVFSRTRQSRSEGIMIIIVSQSTSGSVFLLQGLTIPSSNINVLFNYPIPQNPMFHHSLRGRRPIAERSYLDDLIKNKMVLALLKWIYYNYTALTNFRKPVSFISSYKGIIHEKGVYKSIMSGPCYIFSVFARSYKERFLK